MSFDPATHIAVLPYSSGTTGNPKGVKLSHTNLVANVAQIQPLQSMSSDDAIIAVLLFFHIYGMTVLLNAALYARARLVVMPRFDLVEFLENIQNHKVTYAFIAPPVGGGPRQAPDRRQLRSVVAAHHAVGCRLARRRTRQRRRQAPEPAHAAGLRHERVVAGQSPDPHRFAGRARQDEPPLSSIGWAVPNTENKLIDPATGDGSPFPTRASRHPASCGSRART